LPSFLFLVLVPQSAQPPPYSPFLHFLTIGILVVLNSSIDSSPPPSSSLPLVGRPGSRIGHHDYHFFSETSLNTRPVESFLPLSSKHFFALLRLYSSLSTLSARFCDLFIEVLHLLNSLLLRRPLDLVRVISLAFPLQRLGPSSTSSLS